MPIRRRVLLICIRPGFTRDAGTLAGNGRPATVLIDGCGRGSRSYRLRDEVSADGRTLVPGYSLGDWVSLRVHCKTDQLRLSVKSTYPADDGSHLVAVSDVVFYRGFG